INAAGRMGDATTALELLLTDDPARAGELARELDALNKARKDEDRRTLDGAMEVLTGSYDPLSDFGVVVVGEGWHPGVIGIVASRVVERIHRPTVMVALDGKGGGRGSARSIPGFHVYEALHACRKYLRRFGGHEQAAGMDIDAPAVPEFRAAFREEASRRMEGVSLEPVLEPEVELGLDEADLDLAHWLGYLGPHGMGNRQPVFMARAVHLQEAREVGHGHLKVRLADGASRLDGIGFGLAHRIPPGSLGGGPHDVLFRLERNEWKGRPRAQARVLDLRPAEGRSS
ncbi:MAG: DHH family phosphoesterase, partial [Gemmatimonadota bacterium]|nr:DHH family phosphoesterase [Gemmatimonadota bacterium]